MTAILDRADGNTSERTPPHDMAAEQGALGGMLLSRDAIADVIEVIRPADHYRPAHQMIHEAILGLYGRGEPADAISVANELTRRGEITRMGGGPYLHTLIASVPTAASAGYYARIVREHAVSRRLVETGTRIVQYGYAAGTTADERVDRSMAEVMAVAQGQDATAYQSAAEILPGTVDWMEMVARGGGIKGVPTGFADLDALTNGLHPGQMIVIAGRPALGKSTLGVDIARSAAIKHRLTSIIFSLEMGRDELMMRVLSAHASVPLHSMRTGQMTDDDWARLARKTSEVSGAPLFIDETPGITVPGIMAKCRRLKAQHGLKLVVVDYLQLMSSPNRRNENRQAEVSEISGSLKVLAKELEVPVVALSQLNRGPEQRTDKKPFLSDLRESGSIEQDCDVCILLHREDAYEKESPRAGEADLIVAKHRNGPTATVAVAFQGHYSRFVDMAPIASSPATSASSGQDNAWAPAGTAARR